MTEATEQSQARGEDGRFVSAATPQPDAPAEAAPQQPTEAAQVTQGVAPAEDVYEAAARKVIAADKAATPSQPAVAADRSIASDAATPTPPGPTNADAQQPPSPSPDSKAADPDALAPYAGSLSKAQHDLLKSVPGMLLPADEWRKLTPAEQVEHLQDVRAIRNERNRQFNQTKTAGRPPQAAGIDDRTTPETGQPPRAGGTLEGDGVPTPTTQRPAGQAAAATVGLSAEQQAALQQVAADFGEDSSMYRASLLLARQNAELTQRLAQQDRERQTRAEAQAIDARNRQVEDPVFDGLRAKFPPLANPATRDAIRKEARDYFDMVTNRGRDITPQQAIEFVTRNTLLPEIQAQQQQQAQASRQRSLTGTFDRATPPVNPATPRAAVSEDDVYASVAQGLTRAYASGLSGERAREAARTALAR